VKKELSLLLCSRDIARYFVVEIAHASLYPRGMRVDFVPHKTDNW